MSEETPTPSPEKPTGQNVANWLAKQHKIKTMSRSLKVKDFRILALAIGLMGACLILIAQMVTHEQDIDKVGVEFSTQLKSLEGDTDQAGDKLVKRFSPRNRNKKRIHRDNKRSTPPSRASPPPPPLVNATSTTTPVCLTDQCVQETAASLAQIFPDRSQKEWCNATFRGRRVGLGIVRVPKSASSTVTGAALRIANRNQCGPVEWDHYNGRQFQPRQKHRSFLITTVRDPAARMMSFINFRDVSLNKVQYTEESLLERIQTNSGSGYGDIGNGQGGFTLQFAAMEKIPRYSAWNPLAPETVQNVTALMERVRKTIHGYDFVLVVERMDESLVAMALTMGVDVADVLVTSSKAAGSYFYESNKRKCIRMSQFTMTPAIQAYFGSNQWRAMCEIS